MGGDTFAFRRLELTLTRGRATVLAARAFETRYPFERSGSFECNDKRLNRLWAICARSSEVLSEDAFVDCADRERVEWTDNTPPSWQVARVIMSGLPARTSGEPVWGDGRLQKALLRRIALTARPDGMMKAHSCSERWDIHAIMEDRSCDWVISLRDLYEATGDRALVRELWPACVRLMNWFLAHRTDRGLVLAREWEMWDNPLRYRICEGAGLNAVLYWALRDAILLGAVAGDLEQVKLFSIAADQLAIDFNRLLWNECEETFNAGLAGPGSHSATSAVKDVQILPDGSQTTPSVVYGHYGPTPQAAMLALESNIVPPKRRAAVARYLLTHQEGVTSTMSLWFLIRALYREETEAADTRVLELIRKWWALQIDSPWQTTWESPTGGSKIHCYGLLPAYFLSAWVVGARLGGPVWERTIVIEPHPGGLTYAKGVVMTELGPVPVAWKRSHGSRLLCITFTVPARVTARVRLRGKTLAVNGFLRASTPAGPYHELKLGAGEWTVEAIA